MQKLSLVFSALLVVALLCANAASAQSPLNARQAAKQKCTKLERADGEAFAAAFGEGGTRACARRERQESGAAIRHAIRRCRAERGRSRRSRKAFRHSYRSRRGRGDAFRRCVASKVKRHWHAELREFLAEARECNANHCPSAEPNAEPNAGPGIVPGTGAVVGEDLATDANPSDVWGGQDSPVSKGYEADGADDPYIVRRSGDGDPHVAVGQSSLTSMYRRYISKTGEQSVWDRTGGSGKSTRTQTQAISAREQNEMAFTPGKYVFYLSFRLQSPSPLPYTIEEGGASGNANHSQLFQFKSFGGSADSTFSPPLCGYIGSDGVGISYHDPVDDSKFIETFHVAPGQWVRMAIVADWDREGWYEVWADVDENGNSTNGVMRQVISRQDGGDGLDFLGADRTHSMWGLGLYYNMDLLDGSKAGRPRQDEIHTDYANAQITRYESD